MKMDVSNPRGRSVWRFAREKGERANDLTHWQTRLIVHSAESAEQFLLNQKPVFVSAGVVAAKDVGFKRSLLARDPDGHVMQLIEK